MSDAAALRGRDLVVRERDELLPAVTAARAGEIWDILGHFTRTGRAA